MQHAVVENRLGVLDCAAGARGRFLVVGAVHQQDLRGLKVRPQLVSHAGDHGGESVRQPGRQVGSVAVPVAQVRQEDARTVCLLSLQFTRLVVEAAAQHGGFDAETAQDLRHLADVTERIGQGSRPSCARRRAG